MAPFLPGDFITFAGIRRNNEVIAFSIVAQNVMITTLGDLVYLRMELGLLGIDNFNPNTELAESRVWARFYARYNIILTLLLVCWFCLES